MTAPGSERLDHGEELEELRARMRELETLLSAIRLGEVDAIFAQRGDKALAFTLDGADRPYRELFEQLSEGAATLSEDGAVLFCNRRFAELLGRDADGLIGRPIDGLLGPADGDAFRELLVRYGSELGGGETGRLVLEHTARPLALSLRALPPGGEAAVALVASDLSAERAAAAALQRANDTLSEQVERAVAELRARDQQMIVQSRHAAMGEMIGNIAHQWRQPLNALSMVFANLVDAHAAHELSDEVMQRLALQARQLIHKMSSTISDFQNFFRPHKDRARFSVLEQVQETLALTSATCRNAGIEIEVDNHDDVSVVGFANEFSQVLLNLITNAVHAISGRERADGRIVVHVEREDDRCLVRVVDNGGGIPAAAIERIFEPYFSTREHGTGLGLYMSKQIIERSMGGAITARNAGDGAELSIRVPAANA